jgi:hypothetical protein
LQSLPNRLREWVVKLGVVCKLQQTLCKDIDINGPEAKRRRLSATNSTALKHAARGQQVRCEEQA